MKKRHILAAVIGVMLICGMILTGCGSKEETIPLPDAPKVTATIVSSTSVTVNWNSVSNVTVTGYYLYRSTSSNGSYSKITQYQSWGAGSYSHTDYGLTAGTTYYYKVSAYNGDGEGEKSSAASVTTPNADTPTGINATVTSSSSVSINWGYVLYATGYKVYRSSSENGEYTLITSIATTSYTDTGLSENTTYYYKVSAYNSAGGEGAKSSVVSVKTAIPDTPTNVAASAISGSFSSLRVSWNSVSSASGYKVYRSSYLNGTYTLITTISSTSTLSYTDTGLSADTAYYYYVSSYNGIGESPQSSTVLAETNKGTAPRTPTGLSKNVNTYSKKVFVSWDSVNGADGYKLYRSQSSSGPFSLITTTSSTSYEQNTGGNTFFFQVSAYNKYGESAKSSTK